MQLAVAAANPGGEPLGSGVISKAGESFDRPPPVQQALLRILGDLHHVGPQAIDLPGTDTPSRQRFHLRTVGREQSVQSLQVPGGTHTAPTMRFQ